MPDDFALPIPRPGRLLARGVCRHLLDLDFVTVEEMTPRRTARRRHGDGARGRALGRRVKSSRLDFTSDRKWRSTWTGATGTSGRWIGFPGGPLPEGTGLIVADGYDAEILRMPPETRLAPARRKVMLQKFARHAALRWHVARDPGSSACAPELVAGGSAPARTPFADALGPPGAGCARARPRPSSSAISSASSGSKSSGSRCRSPRRRCGPSRRSSGRSEGWPRCRVRCRYSWRHLRSAG